MLIEVVTLSSSFTTGLGTLQTTIFDFLGAALPVAMVIGGSILGIRLGWKVVQMYKS